MEDLLKLTECELHVLKSIATKINAGDKNYYYLPYWFEETELSNKFIFHSIEDKLPRDLVAAINEIRYGIKNL